MALREWRCVKCGDIQYVFDGEEFVRLRQGHCSLFSPDLHTLIPMPPNPIVIHTTDTWMSEPHLDSFETVYELDRQLNIEAAEEREMKLLHEARKNA